MEGTFLVMLWNILMMQIYQWLSHIGKIELDSRKVCYHQTGFTEHGLITHITNSRNNIHKIILVKVIYLWAYDWMQNVLDAVSIFLCSIDQALIINKCIKYLEIFGLLKQRIVITLFALTGTNRHSSLHSPCRTYHDLLLRAILQSVITRHTGKLQGIIANIIIYRPWQVINLILRRTEI